MLILRIILGSILFLAGAWFLFLEICLYLGETQSFKWSFVPIVIIFIGVGIGLIYGGIKLVKSKQITGVLLYLFAAFLLYVIFSDPKPEGGNLLKLPCFIFPLLLIIGGTLLLKKKTTKE